MGPVEAVHGKQGRTAWSGGHGDAEGSNHASSAEVYNMGICLWAEGSGVSLLGRLLVGEKTQGLLKGAS